MALRLYPLLGRPVSSGSLIRPQMKSLSRTREGSEQTSKGEAGAEVGSKVKAIEHSGLGLAVTGFRSQKSNNTESLVSKACP